MKWAGLNLAAAADVDTDRRAPGGGGGEEDSSDGS